MIQLEDLKPGNWISLNYPGSLLAAHKMIEIEEYGVVIEDGKTNTLIKVGNKREYPQMPRKHFKSLVEIKGIPLTPEIFEGCGFKLNSEITSMQQSNTEGPAKCYSDKHFFMLNYTPGPPNKFTHESSNSNIEFVHQLQNIYADYMKREFEITIDPYNFQLLS